MLSLSRTSPTATSQHCSMAPYRPSPSTNDACKCLTPHPRGPGLSANEKGLGVVTCRLEERLGCWWRKPRPLARAFTFRAVG